MKTLRNAVIGAATGFLLSAFHTFAIEGLALSVQCSNVVLSWPSVEGKTYIVQYRPTLDADTPWRTLTSSLPADVGTNLTVFVHSNIVQQADCGGSFAARGGGEGEYLLTDKADAKPTELVAMRADGLASPRPAQALPARF